MVRRRSAYSPTTGEIIEAIFKLIFVVVLLFALGFAVDAFLTQAALLVLGSWGIICGFWHAFWTVFVLEMIIGSGAYTGSKVAK